MRHHALRPLAAVFAALILAGCGAASSPTPEPTPEPTPTPEASPSIDASFDLSTMPMPSSGAVADLEALIPDEVAGVTLQKSSIPGALIAQAGGGSPEMADLFEALGAEPEDVSMAIGLGLSSDGGGVSIVAFRSAGTDSNRLIQAMRDQVYGSRDVPMDFSESTVGGKTVFSATDPEQANQTVYLYVTGDVLFAVTASDPDLGEEAVAALP